MGVSSENIASFDVLGVPISVTSLRGAFECIVDWSTDDRGRFVIIRDVHGIVQAYDDPSFLQLHKDAALVTPDGMPLVWAGRSRGLPVERTAGADLVSFVLQHSGGTGLRHYFYGGKEGVAEALVTKFSKIAPQAEIVGFGMPPFRPLQEQEMDAVCRDIISSGANVVWIGTSTPKQEFLMSELAKRVPATFIGVGAAFDFHTGLVKRAPVWMQRNGLEWLHRLCSEPRRLWRRYLVMAPKFLFLMMLSRFKTASTIEKHPAGGH